MLADLSILPKLPTYTGCYIFKNKRGRIVYIGKANNIRVRVKQYFNGQDTRWTIEDLLKDIDSIETIQTAHQAEALILESNLVKKHQPKYNRMLKDGNLYSWIYIDTKSSFPTLIKTRTLGMPGKYFGPYPDAQAVNGLLRYIRTLFPYATCQNTYHGKPCLHYHLGMCPGVCVGMITSVEYKKTVIKPIIDLLQGKRRQIEKQLKQQMWDLSADHQYERAAYLRDRIYALEYLGNNLLVKEGQDEVAFAHLRQDRFVATAIELVKRFNLPVQPEQLRIEAYDITHLQSEGMYGSMVVGVGGKLHKDHYRVFKIKKVANNDPQSLYEVTQRRLRHLLPGKKPDESFEALPDIMLIDGGKAQVKAAQTAIVEYLLAHRQQFPQSIGDGLGHDPRPVVIGISKGRARKKRQLMQMDEFWRMQSGKVWPLVIKSPFFLQHLRDEAHRFSRVWLHRQRKKTLLTGDRKQDTTTRTKEESREKRE